MGRVGRGRSRHELPPPSGTSIDLTTDVVAFTAKLGRVQYGCASGTKTRQELGHLMELDERFYPPMYRAKGFPEAQFRENLPPDPMWVV